MGTAADMGSSVATESTDLWGWTTESDPALSQLLAVRQAVLRDPSCRRALDQHLAALGPKPKSGAVCGLARWILGEYQRAWPHLKALRNPSPAVAFARAECCLEGEVVIKNRRPMQRPDLAAADLAKHPQLSQDPVIYATWLKALACDHAMEELEKALKAAPAAFKKSAAFPHYQGRLLEFAGDYEGAEKLYHQALEIDESYRPSLLRLAYQLDLGGDEDAALGMYARLASLEPLDVNATLNYGVMLEDQDRNSEAIANYRAVLKQFPTHRRAAAYLKDAQGSLDMLFDEDVERRHDKRSRLLRIPINDFELSVRARNCLAKMKIETLSDLVQKTEAELLAYKNFGDTSLSEIKILLDSKGLRLGMNLDEDPMPLAPILTGNDQPEDTKAIHLPPGVDPSVVNLVLADLELSVRCRKALSQLKVVTIGDILQHSEAELLALKNFGSTSLVELKTRLSEHGVNLRTP